MLMLGGFLLVTTGAVLAFLMAAHLIEASFPLAFLAYAASLSGLVLGLRVLVIRASGRHHRQYQANARSTEHAERRTIRRRSPAVALNGSAKDSLGKSARARKSPSRE